MTATAGIGLTEPNEPTEATEPIQTTEPTGLTERALPAGGGRVEYKARFWDLEGIRGLAALVIVVFHAYQFARSPSGAYDFQGSVIYTIFLNLSGMVGVFFALSAFVLWRPIVERVMNGDPAMDVRQWTVRRAVRILPLYYFVILTVWSTRNPSLSGDWHDLWEHLTFTFVFDSKRIFYTDGPAWSVAVEVMFYALLGVTGWVLVRAGLHRRSHRARWVGVSCLLPVLLVISPLYAYYNVAVGQRQITDWAAYFGPLAWTTSFGAGMVLAVVHVWWIRREGRQYFPGPVLIAMRVGAVAIFILASAYPAATPYSLTAFRLFSGVSAAMLIGSGVFAPPDSLWRRALGAKWLLFCALISYSLYLWHEPVLLLMNSHHWLPHAPADFPIVAVVLLAASLPVAYLSYRFLELPTGRLRYLFESKRPDTGPTPAAPSPGPPTPARPDGEVVRQRAGLPVPVTAGR